LILCFNWDCDSSSWSNSWDCDSSSWSNSWDYDSL